MFIELLHFSLMDNILALHLLALHIQFILRDFVFSKLIALFFSPISMFVFSKSFIHSQVIPLFSSH